MRVMTFNLRFENNRDGPNDWFCRRTLASQIIERYAPTIVGTQEGKWSQLVYLRDHMSDYRLHAPGRVIDDTAQYPTLYLRNGSAEVYGGSEFWLSKTPGIHRSKDWDSAFPRMMSYAELRITTGDALFSVAVTHLDHIGGEARYEQAKMISKWVRSQSGPVIVMGDFNDSPASPVHGLLTGRETGLMDTWQMAGRNEDLGSFTHHAFNGIPQTGRIDWILVSPHFRVIDVQIIKDHFRTRYPSDHFPYMVDLE